MPGVIGQYVDSSSRLNRSSRRNRRSRRSRRNHQFSSRLKAHREIV